MEQQRGRTKSGATPIPVTGFVLAGGKSARMGRDKGLLEIGGQTLIQSAVNLLKALTDRVFILGPSDRYGFLDLPVLPDLVPSRGPLSAIYTGLEHSETAVNVFLACDMPLMQATFLRLLVERAPLADAVLMRLGGRQPGTPVRRLQSLLPSGGQSQLRKAEVQALRPVPRVEDPLPHRGGSAGSGTGPQHIHQPQHSRGPGTAGGL